MSPPAIPRLCMHVSAAFNILHFLMLNHVNEVAVCALHYSKGLRKARDQRDAIQTLNTLELKTAQQQLAANQLILLDVREATEFAREHIAGARLMPLSNFCSQLNNAQLPRDKTIALCCASGQRSQSAMRKLAAAGFTNIAHLDGGLAAWKASGLPLVEDRSAPIPIMRQVQIVAGSLALAGTLLGVFLSPWFLMIPGLVGAGLIFAGASGSCMMAHLLARLPYNRPQAKSYSVP
jgi:rhodanese-related sulfurtransferase